MRSIRPNEVSLGAKRCLKYVCRLLRSLGTMAKVLACTVSVESLRHQFPYMEHMGMWHNKSSDAEENVLLYV